MKLDYSIKLPTEEEENGRIENERRKNLMTRSSIQATLLGAMQAPQNANGQMAQPQKTGWGSVN